METTLNLSNNEIKGTLYVAGPMRYIKDSNFPAFDKARDKALGLGYIVISPADIDRQDLDREEVEHWDSLSEDKQKEICKRYAIRDCNAIFNCTHMAMLPGWEQSTGAKAELHLAKWLMIKILDATTFEPLDLTKQ